MSARQTQRAQILELLIAACGAWVPLSTILVLGIAQYNARIFELRRLGFHILNRTEEVNGVRHSWFRLELGSTKEPVPAKASTEQPAASSGSLSFPQYGELVPERYPD